MEKKQVDFPASLRIIIPLYLCFVLFAVSIFFIFIPKLKHHMESQKKDTILQLTQSTVSLLKKYDQMVRKGEIPLAEAQEKAVEQIRSLRYGVDGKDYFWIHDLAPKMIMHPYVSELEGKDLSRLKDPQGRYPFILMKTVALEKGDGFVNYYWQWKDTPRKIVPKISYVKHFTPWDWVIGTGMYLEDIQQEVHRIIGQFIQIFLGIFAMIVMLSVYISRQAVQMQKNRAKAEHARDLEELRMKKLLALSQMTDRPVEELTKFALEEAIKLTGSGIGLLAFASDDESRLTLHTWSHQVMTDCEIENKILVYPVAATGLWAEGLRRREAVIINDYKRFQHPGKKGLPQGHVPVTRMLSLPVFDGKKIVALAGVGNKTDPYGEPDVRQLTLMMDGLWKIIQRKQGETALAKSEERYRLLAENATDTIFILTIPDLNVTYVSPAVEQLLGYPPDALIQHRVGPHMTSLSLEKVRTVIQEELESGGHTEKGARKVLELELTKKDGTRVWAEVTARFLTDPKGEPDRILGIMRDITRRRQVARKFRQAQKMEAMGTLAGGIAHDFNNILSSMFGFTELAKLNCEGNPQVLENLDQVLAAGIRARELIRHILTFSRRADVQTHEFKLVPLIKESLKFLKASISPNIRIRHQLDAPDAQVLADPTQMHQVLMNLFTNAVHAMKEGGDLTVGLKAVNVSKDHMFGVKDLVPGPYFHLSVSDTGCGIPKHLVDKIFDPFFTTKERGEGTGMGLSTVYGIIREMGGAISVYSEPSEGTRFSVLLPQSENGFFSDLPADMDQPGKGTGRILVVDDESAIIQWTTLILEKLGYQVLGHIRVNAALDAFSRDPGGVDLVITDLTMPDMDGYDLAGRIKQIRPDIPVVLCTGFSEDITPEILTEKGIDSLLMKPLIAGELTRVIENHLKGA